ncbi:MAG: ribonuclease HI family protein [Nitrososphaerota archaeon]|nr:ribonuclease HI family protein [Nitrososphaerota archaeon]MDG7023076.1 ribonuclease HI family protein [Nitrososphaerota archaeon]
MAVTVYVDGLSEPRNPGTGTFGYLIYDGPKKLAEGSGLAGHDVTSNFAEYTALAEALKRLKALGIDGDVLVRSDSRLLVGHMSEGWKVKGGMYVEKLKEVRDLMKEFGSIRFEWIPREQNREADLLTRIAYEKYKRR